MRTGIRADGARNWQVSSCIFENTENCGILAMAPAGKPVRGNVFSGNIFSRMGDYAIAFSRFEDGPCEISNNIVVGNVARDTQLRTLGHAFGIERADDGVRRPAVVFNNSYIGNIVEQTIDGGYPQGGIVLGDGCTELGHFRKCASRPRRNAGGRDQLPRHQNPFRSPTIMWWVSAGSAFGSTGRPECLSPAI